MPHTSPVSAPLENQNHAKVWRTATLTIVSVMKGTGVHILGLGRASATEKQRTPLRKVLVFGTRRMAVASIAAYK
jgi:hypothetical protein